MRGALCGKDVALVKITNTKDRALVEEIWRFSRSLVADGKAEEVKNWDAKSPWHNSRFKVASTNLEWIVYLSDQAWSGEVRVLKNEQAT